MITSGPVAAVSSREERRDRGRVGDRPAAVSRSVFCPGIGQQAASQPARLRVSSSSVNGSSSSPRKVVSGLASDATIGEGQSVTRARNRFGNAAVRSGASTSSTHRREAPDDRIIEGFFEQVVRSRARTSPRRGASWPSRAQRRRGTAPSTAPARSSRVPGGRDGSPSRTSPRGSSARHPAPKPWARASASTASIAGCDHQQEPCALKPAPGPSTRTRASAHQTRRGGRLHGERRARR